jgi:hypothetical protein
MFPYWVKKVFPKKSRPASCRRPACVQLGLEALEAREVPTVSAFVDGSGILQVSTNANDDVTINHTVTSLGPTTLVNQRQIADFRFHSIHIQGGFDNVNILATSKPLAADDNNNFDVGGSSDDSEFDGNMQNILAPLSLGTANAMFLDDSADPTGQNITLNVVNNVVQVSGMAPAPISIAVQQGALNLDVLGDLELFGGRGFNTFNVLDTPAAFFFGSNITETGINTGSSGDQVNVLGTHSANLNIVGKAFGGFVTIGNNGNLNNIQSTIDVTNPPSFTGLEVDGSASSPQNVTLSVDQAGGVGFIDGLAPQEIQYNTTDLSELILQGSSKGGNTWNVQDTAGLFDGTTIETHGDTVNVLGTTGQLQVLGFGGVDRVNVGGAPSTAGTLANIHGEVDVDNLGGPRTQLVVNDRGDNSENHQVTLNGTSFQGAINVFGFSDGQSAPITYTGSGVQLVQFLGSNASDQFFVQSTPTGTTVELFGGSGNDDFNVGSVFNTLDTIGGVLFVDGGVGGVNSLTVNDGGAAPGHSYVNVPGFIERTGDGGPQVVIEYANIQEPFLIKNPPGGS